jgi:DNA (cytosine-5)-methyltransferase 1
MTPRANLYFSGAGLMDLGLSLAGIDIGESYEIDEAACTTQRLNFGHKVQQCDLTKKLVADEEPCDMRAFTWPCTRYSTAAEMHSTRTGDDLYLHALRHVALKPTEAFVAENVPGMKKFPVVMEMLTRLPGYYVHVVCPVSADTWLPQVRDRLIVIATRRFFLFREPEATGPRATLASILEPNPQVEIPEYVRSRIAGKYRDKPIVSDPAAGDIAPTCVAHYAKDRSTRLVKDARFPQGVRPYTVREYARLQGVPDSFRFAGSDSDAYRQIGNGVAVPMAEWVGRELVRYFNQDNN